jgi:DNA invertase Pin-like site-specific DNA recombinase
MADCTKERGDLRFAWYGRLSTEELQQPQLAFPSQRAACERRVGGVGRIVCDFTDVESGRSSERAGVEALLAEAHRPDRRFDAVVTYKAERFARRMALALAYEEELRLADIAIYVSDEAGEPGRPTSVLTRRIKQAVGEWYVLELQGVRVRAASHPRPGQGPQPGRRPLGSRRAVDGSRHLRDPGQPQVHRLPGLEPAPAQDRRQPG